MTTNEQTTKTRQQRGTALNRWAQRKNDEACIRMVERGGTPILTDWDAIAEQLRADGKFR